MVSALIMIAPSVEMLLVLIISGLLIRRYVDRKRTSCWVTLLAYVGWFLGFSMIIFIPLDIYLTVQNGHAS